MKDLNIDPTKIYTGTIDATPGVLPLIKSGEIRWRSTRLQASTRRSRAHYLGRRTSRTATALPKVGETVKAGELDLNTK